MYILAKYTNQEECNKLAANIPHSDQMLQFVVEKDHDSEYEEFDLKFLVEVVSQGEEGDEKDKLLRYCKNKKIKQLDIFVEYVIGEIRQKGLTEIDKDEQFKPLINVAWKKLFPDYVDELDIELQMKNLKGNAHEVNL